MSKKMPLSDFRAVRKVLEAHEYATGGEDIPPSDLIAQETWHGIMNLPDDVAIKISNHQGMRLSALYGLWGDWLEAMGHKQDPLWSTMLDATDCFQASTFDFLHGYYRSALSNLRSVLELICIGTFGNLFPSEKIYVDWNKNGAFFPFQTCRKGLAAAVTSPVKAIFDKDGLVEQFYHELCNYTHSRPDSSDGALWESNGPVYNNRAINLVFKAQCTTYALCYLLIKIGRQDFNLPEDSMFIFEVDGILNSEQIVPLYKILYA